MNRPGRPRSLFPRCVFVAVCVVTAAVPLPGVRCADDSLRSALDAISDKIGETPPRMVYLGGPPADDGQPEDIGYGYQKNLRNLENIFEQAVPSNKIATKDEIVEQFLDYLAKESPGQQPPYKKKPWSKKSIFREREDSADVPDNLQQLKYDRYAAMPSAFRERYKTANPGIAQDYSDNAEEDQDEYLYAINALVDKYIEDNVEGMSDEELESFLRSQDEKRNAASPDDYQSLYAEPYNYYKRGRKLPAERQFLFIPRFQARRNNKYGQNNRWMKPRLMKRSKKNISSNKESRTDPKVAAELNNIFLGSGPNDSDVNTSTTTAAAAAAAADMTNTNSVDKTMKPAEGGNNTKIELKKKSIDWSNYFGYDRKKKSIDNIPSDDDTILNQYMRTYGKENEVDATNSLKDDKLMWLEDALIDDALKYTGANRGTNDPDEINNVKNQVLTNLNQAYNIEKLRQENKEMREKQYEKSDLVLPAENNSQPVNFLETSEERPHKESDHKECTQLLQITQDCLELGGSAGDLMLPVCTLYRVCRTCESEHSECEEKFVQSSHELCSKAPLCRYFSRRMLQLMQDHPLQMECHKCMINFLQNED